MTEENTVRPAQIENHGWRVTFAAMGINLALGILYTWRCFSEHRVFSRYFMRHAISTLAYVGLMFYFVAKVMGPAQLDLF